MLISVLVTVPVFLPVAWLVPLLETQTAGRITLGDAQGTLWQGSAFIGAAPSDKEAVIPLMPGRFNWRLSPLVLLGQVDVTLENPATLSLPVSLSGSWHEWSISDGSIVLPAERLSGLGAPLNTLQPSGQMRLSWKKLRLARQADGIDLHGAMMLDLTTIASRLSSVKPLGSYRMRINWQQRQATLNLETLTGSLILNGSGQLNNGHLQFSGTAQAAVGQEEKLANLLSLMGQRRQINGKNVIGLEFK